jgi:hypothetical protein
MQSASTKTPAKAPKIIPVINASQTGDMGSIFIIAFPLFRVNEKGRPGDEAEPRAF